MQQIRITLLMVLLTLACGQIKAQSIHGFIRADETGEPLPYANIILPDLNRGTVSNIDGYYVIPNLPVGQHLLLVTVIGYRSFSQDIDIAMDENLRLDIRLRTEIIEGQTVEVSAERERFRELVSPSTVNLDRRTIEVAPSFVEADVFRALQMLPGVQSLNDFSSALYVRGSTPDQNLIMLDGITVYNPMHLGGVFSTFNTDAIKEADFHAGGFGARYGGRLGSILNIVNREGNTEELQGNANISLLSSKLLLEGPLPLGFTPKLKGSWMVAGRRTYFDIIVNEMYRHLIVPNLSSTERETAPDNVFPYYFYDFQGKLNLDIGSDHRLTWSSFYGDDVFYFDFTDTWSSDDDLVIDVEGDDYYESTSNNRFDWKWGNFTNSLSWRWVITPQLIARTSLANSRYRFWVDMDFKESSLFIEDGDTVSGSGKFQFDLFDKVGDQTVESQLTWLPNEDHTITGGLQYKDLRFNLGMVLQLTEIQNQVDTSWRNDYLDTLLWQLETPTEGAFYLEDRWQISPLLSAEIGLRLPYYEYMEGTRLEPRLGLKYFLTPKLSAKMAVGRYHQFLAVANPPDENLRFIDIWFGLPEDKPIPRSDHTVLGLEYLTDTDILLRVETYYKSFDHLLTLKPSQLIDVTQAGEVEIDPFNEFYDTDAYAKGLEFLLRKTSGAVRGWLGYTLAETRRRYSDVDWYHPKYDRTHTLNAVADWQLSKQIHISTAFTYSTGNPYTPIEGRIERFQDEAEWIDSGWWIGETSFLYGQRHSARYPDYLRWDVSIQHRKEKWGGEREWYFQVLNVTNHMNVFTYIHEDRQVYDPQTGNYVNKGVERLSVPMFPLTPTFGIKYVF